MRYFYYYGFICSSCHSRWGFNGIERGVPSGATGFRAVVANYGFGCPRCGSQNIILRQKICRNIPGTTSISAVRRIRKI